jgi:hypothetical protein
LPHLFLIIDSTINSKKPSEKPVDHPNWPEYIMVSRFLRNRQAQIMGIIEQKINLSVKEAEKYGIKAWTWRAWAYSGKITSVKAGSRLLIPVAECERVMREGTRHRQGEAA